MKTQRVENQYLAIAEDILEHGEIVDDRTGVGTKELFGAPQMCTDLRTEFPLLTSKKIATRAITSELTWMLHGDTNLRYLAEHRNHIWDEWPFTAYLKATKQPIPEQGSEAWSTAKENFIQKITTDDDFAASYGDMGPIYGHQWRAWEGADGVTHDQLHTAQDQIRSGKASRRIIVSAWNVGDLEAMDTAGLPPCHTLFQFNTSSQRDPETDKPYLDMKLYQRSADWFLGVPFNMAQYALLLSAMAQTTDHTPRHFYHTFGSAHIYANHVDQMHEQLSRKDDLYAPAALTVNPNVTDIGDFEPDDFTITGYQHHAGIRGQVAI